MGLFDNAVPGGNISKPIMIALGALLVGKFLSGRGGSQDDAAQQQQPDSSAGSGLLGGLGGLLGGALGGGLAGNAADGASAGGGLGGGVGGGLGDLLGKLADAGHGDTVNSWVQPGAANQPIEPGHLQNALGSQTISDLAAKAGISEEELLQQLSAVLPGLVDKLTPNGQIPDQNALASLFRA